MSEFIREIKICDGARIPVVWFVTQEELRAESGIANWVLPLGGQVWVWSLTSNGGGPGWELPVGVSKEDRECPFDTDMQTDPAAAIRSVIDHALSIREDNDLENAAVEEQVALKTVAIFRDAHVFFESEKSFVRMIRDAARELKDSVTTIVFISPMDKLPPELEVDVHIIHPGLPDKEALTNLIKKDVLPTYGLEDFPKTEELIEACRGLTMTQASDAVARSVATLGEIDVTFIYEIKTEQISSVPGLTFERSRPDIDSVGGLAGIKQWINQRKRGFQKEARDYGLPIPRGILLLGVQGTGKSLCAKAIASSLNLPLIRFSPHDMKGGIVGDTERNIRTVKAAIEGVGQSVLWLDEIGRSFAKQGERNSDGGTSDALTGGFLHWFQERPGGAFLVATGNDVSDLPPELLRKGRWDEIFFVDLPTEKERAEIVKIHLSKRGRVLSEKSVNQIVSATEGFSGAEIECSILDGMWAAFDDGRDVTGEDIAIRAKASCPLSEMMAEPIKALREWASRSARSASEVISTEKSALVKLKAVPPQIGEIAPIKKRRAISLDKLEEKKDE